MNIEDHYAKKEKEKYLKTSLMVVWALVFAGAWGFAFIFLLKAI